MNINWEPTKGNHYQARRGVDDQGNRYRMTANLKAVSVVTPDGYRATDWTAEGALASANEQRQRANAEAEPVIRTAIPLGPEDIAYWEKRAAELLGEVVEIVTMEGSNDTHK